MKGLEITTTSTNPRHWGIKNMTSEEIHAVYEAIKTAQLPTARNLHDLKELLEETFNPSK